MKEHTGKRRVSLLLALVMAIAVLSPISLYMATATPTATDITFENNTHDQVIDKAIRWLEQSQNTDGSWGTGVAFLETCTVLANINSDQFSNTSFREKGLSWLNTYTIKNNDELSRLLTIPEMRAMSNIAALLRAQNADGGWALSGNYMSNAFDTMLAVQAIIGTSLQQNDVLTKAQKFLVSSQNSDGSWGYNSDTSSIYMTGNIIKLLERLRAATKSTNESLEISISNGREYLLSTEDTGNAWGMTKD